MNTPFSSTNTGAGPFRLRICSDILSTNAAQIRESVLDNLNAAASAAAPLIEVDLRGTRIVDSVGLNLLVSVIKRAREWGGKTRLLVDNPNVIRTLQFTRLDTQAEVVRP